MFNIQVFGFGHGQEQDIELDRSLDKPIHEFCVPMPVWIALNLVYVKNNMPWWIFFHIWGEFP